MAANRLKMAQVENRPALQVIEQYDTPNTLFYVDPPYVLRTRSEGSRARYAYEMSDDEHRVLAAALLKVQGMVILSGYHGPLYEELYADWRRIQKTTTTNGNSTATEYLWLSLATDKAAAPLFRSMS